MKETRFLTDGMLGKLTRWLRMLGQDVEYTTAMADETLILEAKKTSRILLTRDIQLFQRAMTRGAEALLIEGMDEAENLADLATRFKFKLQINLKTSRCSKCNTQIRSVRKDRIIDRIPEKTSTYYNEFWECPNCKQVYWQGAHWKRIEKTLRDARKALKK
ncbi:MAG: Mut7-C RNAse domain-containing protein [Candidatus Bathyarchaeota archaeon]|nr:MAG: Mut7-C RNAse domain-containing protein [Candidatus Bathyarchaeota archaeon]